MKLARIGRVGHERPVIVADDGRYHDISSLVGDLAGAALARESLAKLGSIDLGTLPIIDAAERIGPCVAGVGKFICVGLNYADHAAETGATNR